MYNEYTQEKEENKSINAENPDNSVGFQKVLS